MLTAPGCRDRRVRLWERLQLPPEIDRLVLMDPCHLRYFANADVDAIHLAADFRPALVLDREGGAVLVQDTRMPASLERAHVDERVKIAWYDGQSPGKGPRQLVVADALRSRLGLTRVHDHPCDPLGPAIIGETARMRRQKDPDEIAQLRACMEACAAGHRRAREVLRAGMSELDLYQEVCRAVHQHVGRPVIVYGDFVVSPGPERRGGPPSTRELRDGDMVILDYSVVIQGYRSDFTNTLVVGGQPRPEQRELYELCMRALSAGACQLRAGQSCRAVYDAVRQVFVMAGVADAFPHHAGHGLGLMHPEAPFFVRQTDETLLENDVVTLEPGLYIENVGGIRIEHNYRVTADGFEQLSGHEIRLN